MTQDELLDRFWASVSTDPGFENRMACLRDMAEQCVVRQSGWNHQEIRRAFAKHKARVKRIARLRDQPFCFACWQRRPSQMHHVIQVQNGGSNDRRNLVQICGPCHGMVHPWLALEPSTARRAKPKLRWNRRQPLTKTERKTRRQHLSNQREQAIFMVSRPRLVKPDAV